MIRRVVCDASAMVALLIDSGADGLWVTRTLDGADLSAPTLMPFECANIIRRLEMAGKIGSDQAAQAHADLLDLEIELWPYEPSAPRAWELRRNMSIYDASYVAVAEILDALLITLDRRLGLAPGPRCVISTPKD